MSSSSFALHVRVVSCPEGGSGNETNVRVVTCPGGSVWQAHNDSIPTAGGSGEVRQLSEEDVKTLESAFEQVQYFTEDLDHAKGQTGLQISMYGSCALITDICILLLFCMNCRPHST